MAEPVDRPVMPRFPHRTSVDVGYGCSLVVEHFAPIVDLAAVEEVARTLMDLLLPSKARGVAIGIPGFFDDAQALQRVRIAGDGVVVYYVAGTSIDDEMQRILEERSVSIERLCSLGADVGESDAAADDRPCS